MNGMGIPICRRTASRRGRRVLREERNGMRYPIQVPVRFSWSVRNGAMLARYGAMRQGKGRSRDISEGGAFVFARNLPPVGASISLSIQFLSAGSRFLRMEVTGEVVR